MRRIDGRRFRLLLDGLILILILALGVSISAFDHDKLLSFDDRVRAQEAIERVYYEHRIWPKENPGPKPPFGQMISRPQIEAKVEDYLKKSAALEKFWQRPLTAEQLQAEMDRMAKATKDPETLKALFAALGNDPHLPAECLARPLLADRLIRSWYARDSRFHAETQARAEAALERGRLAGLKYAGDGEYMRTEILLEENPYSEMGKPEESGGIRLSPKDFERQKAALPEEGELSAVREGNGSFFIIKTLLKADRKMEIERLSFRKRGMEDWLMEADITIPKEGFGASGEISYMVPEPAPNLACMEQWDNQSLIMVQPRQIHTAVWTGTEMIVWGGYYVFRGVGPFYDEYHVQQTGGRYSPSTDTWSPTSIGANCPSARCKHAAIWTGTEMIVWGGSQNDSNWYINTGGRYNPASDTWIATSTGTNCPSARAYHTAVWTGTVMIVWGGYDGMAYINTGGRYTPSADTWQATSIGANCPTAREGHTAVWRGSRMIIWGGHGSSSSLNTGGKYDPVADTWLATSTGTNCPSARAYHTAVWTGTVMIVWGGYNGSTYLNTGGQYTPVADTWSATSMGSNCPSLRAYHTAVWTGSQMIVWGGENGSTYLNSGGRYTPGTDTWAATSTGINCPADRTYHTAVWTGSEMIIWGGTSGGYVMGPAINETNTGGRYNPSTDSWVPTHYDAGTPSGRSFHTAVWTGAEMIIWGGAWDLDMDRDQCANYRDGAMFYPSTDSWTPTNEGAACPQGRWGHTAVWTGTEMIIWGGMYGTLPVPYGYYNSGGRFNPSLNTWIATSMGTDCPEARSWHTAVWTGREMIVWGGYYDYYNYVNTGGRYLPGADTWQATPTGEHCPISRSHHTSVWTGNEMIVWGGHIGFPPDYIKLNSGARCNPSLNSWLPTSSGAYCPCAKDGHAAIWSGTEMIIWSGGTGGRYNPSTDSWTTTSTGVNCPTNNWAKAVWTGSEMIVWGGWGNPGLNTGGRYNPSSDTWLGTAVWGNVGGRYYHTAAWTGSQMIVWGGYNAADRHLNTGGIYSPGATLAPIVTGSSQGCAASPPVLSTDTYSAYQWMRNGLDIGGAVGHTHTTTQGGAYSVRVTDMYGCTGTSADKVVTFYPPEVTGTDHNTCPETTVALSTGTYPAYQWSRNGQPIPGATERTYAAALSGDYSVTSPPPSGCTGESVPFTVTVSFCAASEVSPQQAIFPLRVAKDGGSSTGHYLYFQKIAGTDGYNIYGGDIGTWYSHASAPGNVCDAAVTDLGTGEMRAELNPSTGNHYYLVTAYGGGAEGPSGFSSSAVEIDPLQSTCAP